MLIAPIAHIEAVDRGTANALLVQWAHRMGPMNRPKYALEAHHALFEHGEPVAVICTGETVRESVAQTNIRRNQCVELVRLCAAREHLCRPFLRLWREMCFPAISAAHGRSVAVSYQDTALHSGNVYRFDGWLDIGAAGGNSVDARTGRKGRKMRVWAWPPDEARRIMSVALERAEK